MHHLVDLFVKYEHNVLRLELLNDCHQNVSPLNISNRLPHLDNPVAARRCARFLTTCSGTTFDCLFASLFYESREILFRFSSINSENPRFSFFLLFFIPQQFESIDHLDWCRMLQDLPEMSR